VPTATSFEPIRRESDDDHSRSIERAFARLRDDLGRAMKRLADCPEPAIGGALDRFALTLCDARLRERLAAAADRPSALRLVAREYARVRLGQVHPTHRPERGPAHPPELEELCAMVGDARALKPGAIWIADRIDSFVALVAAARGASALVASDAISATAIAIARAARIPTVSDVSGLFAWARPDDLLAVDGHAGVVLVHPAPSDIERLRER
jgi:signal transduction protein with GAF and PtsI domain